jgi:hypothetical protein
LAEKRAMRMRVRGRRNLPGSWIVKCEIVVPILVRKKLAAALDIESYFANTFTSRNRTLSKPAPPSLENI